MKITLRILGALLGLFLVVFLLQLVASESGEVVVLTTTDESGEAHETRLWVVDHEGDTWLRSGGEIQGWYQRLVARPDVQVERGGTQTAYRAELVPEARDAINAQMNAKYGWADEVIGLIFGRGGRIPVRLVDDARVP